MILKVYIGEQTFPVEVPKYVVDEAEDYFAMIDRDLDGGFQMSRHWVQKPSITERCQIVADRLLTAIHADNEKTGIMMAAYILARMPGVTGIRMDLEGDMREHELIMGPRPV